MNACEVFPTVKRFDAAIVASVRKLRRPLSPPLGVASLDATRGLVWGSVGSKRVLTFPRTASGSNLTFESSKIPVRLVAVSSDAWSISTNKP